MNLGCEVGLEAERLHLGTMVLELGILVELTKPTLGTFFMCKSDPVKPNLFEVLLLKSVRFSAPLSITEAMDESDKRGIAAKLSKFELTYRKIMN